MNKNKENRFILGTWNFADNDWQLNAEWIKNLNSVIDMASEREILRIDTAPIYGLTKIEEQIGKHFKRHNFEISTKFGLSWANPYNHKSVRVDLSKIEEQCENSLKRLKIDSLDVCFIHHPPYLDLSEEQFFDISVLIEKLKRAGKIKRFGICNAIPEVHPKCFQLKPEIIQFEYNALKRWAETKVLVPLKKSLKNKEIKAWSFSPLARGLLTSKYSGDEIFAKEDHRNTLKYFKNPSFKNNIERVNSIKDISEKYKVPLAAVFIRWVLDFQRDFDTILGVKDITQLTNNLLSLDFELNPEEILRIKNLFYNN